MSLCHQNFTSAQSHVINIPHHRYVCHVYKHIRYKYMHFIPSTHPTTPPIFLSFFLSFFLPSIFPIIPFFIFPFLPSSLPSFLLYFYLAYPSFLPSLSLRPSFQAWPALIGNELRITENLFKLSSERAENIRLAMQREDMAHPDGQGTRISLLTEYVCTGISLLTKHFGLEYPY